MPPGEVSVTCPNCGATALLPVAAIRRDISYCSRCFKRIPLAGLRSNPTEDGQARAKPARRSYRPSKRR